MKLSYFIGFLITVAIEIAIATYTFHPFIRSFVGDVLVIPLLFFFLKSFLSFSSERIAIAVLLFAFGIEFLQFIKILELLDIRNPLAKIVIGTTFDWMDLLAYSIGYFTLPAFIKKYKNVVK
ncbi:DUF2809 domain-containing protein [Candidatus Ulvibacter alkanivorans]|uniref:ribosomal maturation YjgA family protein n=1 Tax=Candidatus Ulvibacter alkanivorans TaxID=2267620 RepID=UPI000DF1E839|nr:DUF2809 domain-containing protein [Candidatus Ulvibacter alkanivorans]